MMSVTKMFVPLGMDVWKEELIRVGGNRKTQESGHKKQVKIGIQFCEDGNGDFLSDNTLLSPQGWIRFCVSACFHTLKYVG